MVSVVFTKRALGVLTGILLYLMAFIPFLVIHMTKRRDFSLTQQVLSVRAFEWLSVVTQETVVASG